MRRHSPLQDAMLAAVPDMRAFALSLCRQRDRVDDLVQEALLRAIANIQSFEAGTNMRAWLFTILRNNFLNECRKARHEVSDGDEYYIDTMSCQPQQDAHMQLEEFRAALAQLPHDQREAVVLIGGAGLSYDEAAQICRCPAGTLKSRANRGRARLAELLSIERADDLGPDRAMQAALSGGNLRWAA